MKLYLLRHGETDRNIEHLIQGQEDIPLNEKGLEQAREARKMVEEKGFVFDLCYSSPLSRARRTGEIVSGLPEEKIIIEPRLKEMNFGVLEGTVFSPFTGGPGSLADPVHYQVPEGGEDFKDVAARTGSFVDELLEKRPAESILIASHGAAIRSILLHLGMIDLAGFWDFRIGNCAIIILETTADGRYEMKDMIQGQVLDLP